MPDPVLKAEGQKEKSFKDRLLGSRKGSLIMEDEEPLVEPLPQAQARIFFREILRGMEYLFFQNVVHRGEIMF